VSHKPISNDNEYYQLHEEFNKKFSIYRQLDEILAASTQDFVRLNAYFKDPLNSFIKDVARKAIERLYSDRNEKIQRMLKMYRVLHEELKDIKRVVEDYLQQRQQPFVDSIAVV
jgi:ATP-dependent protease HslVU (ClpYQ) peptidase subunit